MIGGMHRRFNPPTGWPQAGRAFNHGVVAGDGRVLHMTGQVAWDAGGSLVGEGDCDTQIRRCFDNVEHILAAVGGVLEDIVSMTVYFVDREDLPVIQRVRAGKFAPDQAPASILIQVPGLVAPELLVELVPVAVIPFDRYREPGA